MTTPIYIYEHLDKVRDYECDLQGIVNNANYQHYLEHARHEFLLSCHISFSDMHDQGIDWVVYRAELDYKISLKSKDEYAVKIYVRKRGVRWIFHQDIYHRHTGQLCVSGVVYSVATRKGRPIDCPEMEVRLKEAIPDIRLSD